MLYCGRERIQTDRCVPSTYVHRLLVRLAWHSLIQDRIMLSTATCRALPLVSTWLAQVAGEQQLPVVPPSQGTVLMPTVVNFDHLLSQ